MFLYVFIHVVYRKQTLSLREVGAKWRSYKSHIDYTCVNSDSVLLGVTRSLCKARISSKTCFSVFPI